MNRESISRLATRAYPPEVRSQREAEVVGTLLDAGDESPAAFALQVASVTRAGLIARTRAALTQPPVEIVICALAWGAVLVLVRILVNLLGFEVRASGQSHFSQGALLTWILPALIVVLFTARQTRLSGILGIAFIGWHLADIQGPLPGRVFAVFVLPLCGFALLALAPRRIPAAGRWVWLAPAAVLTYFFATQIGLRSGVDIIVPLLVALCFLPFQPPFAIGWTIAWAVPNIISLLTFPGPWPATSYVLVSCLPVAVIATGLGRLRVRRD